MRNLRFARCPRLSAWLTPMRVNDRVTGLFAESSLPRRPSFCRGAAIYIAPRERPRRHRRGCVSEVGICSFQFKSKLNHNPQRKHNGYSLGFRFGLELRLGIWLPNSVMLEKGRFHVSEMQPLPNSPHILIKPFVPVDSSKLGIISPICWWCG